MVKICFTKNKKIRIFLICTVGIIASVIIYLLGLKVNNYLDQRSAIKSIDTFIDNSNKGYEKGVKDCFIKEYQKSLDLYKKYNPKKKLFDWKIIKLEKIKEIPKKYGDFDTIAYNNSFEWSRTKVFYAKVIKKVKKEDLYNYNGVNYVIFKVTKQNNKWKIIYVWNAFMRTIFENNIGFGDNEEKSALNRENKRIRQAVCGIETINDYRNMFIPKYNKYKSVNYNRPYSKLKNEIKSAFVKFTNNGKTNKYYIKNKTNIIKIVKAFDKLTCQFPTNELVKSGDFYSTDDRGAFYTKIKGYQEFMITKYNNEFYYWYSFYPPRIMPKKLVNLLKLN